MSNQLDAKLANGFLGIDKNRKVRFGADYYQMMVLWAVPPAIESKSIGECCAAGGFVDQVLTEASDQEHSEK